MKVFIVSEADDTGGVAASLGRLFRRLPASGVEIHSMRGSDNYIRYPADLTWDPATFRGFYDWADVIHCMEKWENVELAARNAGITEPKPMVVHHHGTMLREDAGRAGRAARDGLLQGAATLDLTMLHEGIRWLPSPIDQSFIRAVQAVYRPIFDSSRPITVGHMPTQRYIKGTDQFLAATSAYAGRLAVRLVERVSWLDSLAAKAQIDVYFDQLQFGYGLSALECWAMNIPVISGAKDPAVRDVMVRAWGDLPYLPVADAGGIIAAIEALVEDRGLQREYAERGYWHLQLHHGDDRVAQTFLQFWRDALTLA